MVVGIARRLSAPVASISTLPMPLSAVLDETEGTRIAGIVCINVDVFTGDPALPAGLPHKLLGVLCALGALASWTWFAVENARYLKRNAHFDSNEWSVLWGVVIWAIRM